MNIHFPYQVLPLLASLTLINAAQAACRPDAPEIGDIGPDSESVCHTLAQEFPSAEIQLYGLKLLSPTHVIVAAKIDDKPYAIDYRLVRADWVKDHGPCLAGL